MEKLSLHAENARYLLFDALGKLGSGHYGACLSVIELLTYLYFKEMNISPETVDSPERDFFILSKGHAGFGLYAVLCERGFIQKERLSAYEDGVQLPKHADKHRIPGVELSTGSLGIGFSASVGYALSFKRSNAANKVYTLLGDGECNEGIVWEAAMAAGKYKLSNLIAIVDFNNLQFDGRPENIMPLEPFAQRWETFGWNTVEIDDGHDFKKISDAFSTAASFKDSPTVIIAHTVKGKGISFMEDVTEWHGGSCSSDQIRAGLAEINERIEKLMEEQTK